MNNLVCLLRGHEFSHTAISERYYKCNRCELVMYCWPEPCKGCANERICEECKWTV